MNAVVDALSEIGIEHIDMPATPQRLWAAIRAARAAGPGSKRGRKLGPSARRHRPARHAMIVLQRRPPCPNASSPKRPSSRTATAASSSPARDEIGVFFKDGAYFAYSNYCVHSGGPACEGIMINRVVDVIAR